MGFRAFFSEVQGLTLLFAHIHLRTVQYTDTMDLLSSFNIEEDSEVDCGYSLIINGKSSSGSDSGPNNETPSDCSDNEAPSDLGPSLGPYYVDNTPRIGRPKTSTATAEFILKTMLKNSTTRSWSCNRIASEVSGTPGWQPVSPSTVYRVLKEHGYGVYKRTVKPGLTKEQMAERLKQCLEHKDWKLEDWKNVIWTDETSVQLGGVRGRRRVWRRKDEAHHEHVITRRWKGFKEFMWWSCFSYDKKGPFHIWEEETLAERKACEADLKARNATRHNKDKEEWEMAQLIHRLHATRAQSGQRAKQKHTEETGAYVLNKGKGGINWYCYQQVILKPLLLPFAKEYKKDRPKTVVQEDNAPAHASHYQQEVYTFWEVQRLLWPGNSLDLNAIEPTWFWMKRQTTRKGPITSNKKLKEEQIKCWKDMLQKTIQAWIERIPEHIEEIIAQDGNNLYKEGRKKGQEKRRIH